MSAADYAGIVTCIGALTGGITSIVVAFRQAEAKRTLDVVNDQVATPGERTLGETVAHVHDVVCNGTT